MNDLHPKSEELLVFSSINQSPPRRLGMPLETAEESDNMHLEGILKSCSEQLGFQQPKPKSAYVIWSEAERMKINRQHHFYRSQNGLVVPPRAIWRSRWSWAGTRDPYVPSMCGLMYPPCLSYPLPSGGSMYPGDLYPLLD